MDELYPHDLLGEPRAVQPSLRWRALRRVLYGWLIVVAALGILALVMRNVRHRELRRQMVAELAKVGEANDSGVEDYIYGNQSLVVYLLERGYASPNLLRELLLSEARRCYDWQYLSTEANNYDLRTRLIAHCLRDFPEDAKVHWGAGQLSLLDGDWAQAQRELRRAIELAEKLPGGVHAFCAEAGISEQHLRGRLAAADTLMGDWPDADHQLALAKQAGDGKPPPPPGESYYYDDSEKQAAAQANELRKVAQRYAQTRDPRLLKPWQDEMRQWQVKLSKMRPTDEQVETPKEAIAGLHQALSRAYLLTHEWDRARAELQPEAEIHTYDYSADLRELSGLLLTRLAAGQKLGKTARENVAEALPRLQKEADESGYPLEQWSLDEANCGELSGLLSVDYLPYLLRTDMFADALKHSGRNRDEVLAEVREVTQPVRRNYSAYWDTGQLDWK